jgi:hypothetical protein
MFDMDNPLSIEAGVDLSGSGYCAVTLDTTAALGKLALPAAGAPILGILYNKPALGRMGKVFSFGSGARKARYGGNVTTKDLLKVDSSGRFLTASAQDVLDGKAVAIAHKSGVLDGIGLVTMIGAAGATSSTTASEAITTAAGGAVASSNVVHETLVTIATANATGTLADGKFVGQKKKIRVDSDAGGFKYDLTPTTMRAGGPAMPFSFTSKGQMLELTWSATGWWVSDIKTAGTPAVQVAAAGTFNPLIGWNNITIGSAGLETRTLPDGFVAGHTISILSGVVGTGTCNVAGTLRRQDTGANGTNALFNAAGDLATLTWDGARWIPAALVSVTIT